MSYAFAIEDFVTNLEEAMPLYVRHYAEMQERLRRDGIEISPFNPRVSEYVAAARAGWLIHYVIRKDGEMVGYSNIYLTHDMHNRDLIAEEDTIFVLPQHRNGIGRKFSHFILKDLRERGVKRLSVKALTDLRVAKLWKRMGFKHSAHCMTYTF